MIFNKCMMPDNFNYFTYNLLESGPKKVLAYFKIKNCNIIYGYFS